MRRAPDTTRMASEYVVTIQHGNTPDMLLSNANACCAPQHHSCPWPQHAPELVLHTPHTIPFS